MVCTREQLSLPVQQIHQISSHLRSNQDCLLQISLQDLLFAGPTPLLSPPQPETTEVSFSFYLIPECDFRTKLNINKYVLICLLFFFSVPGRVRVAVRLRPRNAEELVADADFADCVELQPEVKFKNSHFQFSYPGSRWL